MGLDEARKLLDSTRKELSELDGRIKNHPYITALEAGEISREALKGFAGHQYYIIGSDMRSVANLLSHPGMLVGRKFLTDLLLGESAAFDTCLTFATALELDEGWLKAYELRPGAVAYAHYVAWLGAYGTGAELAAAFAVNFGAWGANCGRMRAALEKQYGFDKKSLAFFELFADTPPAFQQEALEVVADGLRLGVEPKRIRQAARLLQSYELSYWDAMNEL